MASSSSSSSSSTGRLQFTPTRPVDLLPPKTTSPSGLSDTGAAGVSASWWTVVDSSTNPKPVRLKITEPKPVKTVEVDENGDVDEQLRQMIKNGLLQPLSTEVIGAIEDGGEIETHKQTLRRKVRYTVEVPTTRKVKVPATSTEEMDVEDVVKVQTTEQVQVQTYKDVEEEYTDFEEVTAYRLKEVWVKKLVPEAYTKKVEVKKTRVVQVPTTVTQEVPVEKEVKITRKQIREVPGFRIDEIKDTKLVEVEGWQELELVPQLKDIGKLKIERTVDISGPRGQVIERKVGQLWDVNDVRLDQVDTDSEEDSMNISRWSQGLVVLDGTERRIRRKEQIVASSSKRVREMRRNLQTSSTTSSNAVSVQQQQQQQQASSTSTTNTTTTFSTQTSYATYSRK